MDRNEILRGVIKRAVDNGFELHPHKHFMTRNRETGEMFGYESIIFDHGFAKALWGEKWLRSTGPGLGNYDSNKGWLHHLQEMVIAEDPLEYLAANT